MRTRDERIKLYNENLGLVYSLSFKYKKDLEHLDFYEDILQEGFMALWIATGRYDESKGVKFSTYAHKMAWGQMSKYYHRFVKQRKREHYDIPILHSLNEVVPGTRSEDGVIEYIDLLTVEEQSDKFIDLLESIIKLAYEHRFEIDNIYDIIRMREKGLTQQQIAKRFYTTQTTIYRRLKEFKKIAKKELAI